jgi:hypothetical protein
VSVVFVLAIPTPTATIRDNPTRQKHMATCLWVRFFSILSTTSPLSLRVGLPPSCNHCLLASPWSFCFSFVFFRCQEFFIPNKAETNLITFLSAYLYVTSPAPSCDNLVDSDLSRSVGAECLRNIHCGFLRSSICRLP